MRRERNAGEVFCEDQAIGRVGDGSDPLHGLSVEHTSRGCDIEDPVLLSHEMFRLDRIELYGLDRPTRAGRSRREAGEVRPALVPPLILQDHLFRRIGVHTTDHTIEQVGGIVAVETKSSRKVLRKGRIDVGGLEQVIRWRGCWGSAAPAREEIELLMVWCCAVEDIDAGAAVVGGWRFCGRTGGKQGLNHGLGKQVVLLKAVPKPSRGAPLCQQLGG